MKKIICLALALLMVLALVGCKSNKRQIVEVTLSTEDSEAILAAAGIRLPDVEQAAAAGTTIKYCSWYDGFHNYSEDEIVNTGYFTFKEKYGCEIEWIEVDYFERFNALANLILTEDAPDFYPAGSSSSATFPQSCIKGTFQPIDDYVDYDDPLWVGMKEAAEYFALGDTHFAFVTDITFRHIVPYNTRVVDEWGFDDPAELYANDEWTWDVFYEMCMEFSDADEERYALDGYSFNDALVQQATGKKLVGKDADGHYFSNLDDPLIEAANNLLYDLVKNECTYREGTNYWAGRNDHQAGAGVKDGLCLFYIATIDEFTGTVEEISSIWGDVTQNELMFVPLPRYHNGDGNYYLTSIPAGYMLVTGAQNPEGVALLASCERFKIIDPTVIDIDKKQLKETYLWTDEMLDMRDHCYELAQKNVSMYYNGDFIDGLNNAYNSLRDGVARSATSWAQLKENNTEAFEYYLEQQNALVDEYIESGF